MDANTMSREQSRWIAQLVKEIDELKKENKRLRHELQDAQAIIVVNHIERPKGPKKVLFVPEGMK